MASPRTSTRLNEAQKVLVQEAGASLFTIAKDVKLQVEFNPATVAEYRLVGYETRALKREDFNNDAVDAGDVGSGHTVTAIYEITPVGVDARMIDESRYGKKPQPVATGSATEYGFLKIRYKLPKDSKSQLIEQPISIDSGKAPEAIQRDVRVLDRGGGFRAAAARRQVHRLAELRGRDQAGSGGARRRSVRLSQRIRAAGAQGADRARHVGIRGRRRRVFPGLRERALGLGSGMEVSHAARAQRNHVRSGRIRPCATPGRDAAPGSRELLPESGVCVIGAGIAGLTTAYLLQRAGHKVQVLDAASSLAAGETGRTTAHLSAVLDDNFCRLEQLFGTDGMRLAAASHAAAIDCIQAIVETEHINCDFERLDGLLVAADADLNGNCSRRKRARCVAPDSPRMQAQESVRTGQILIDGPALRFPRSGHVPHRPVHARAGARLHTARRTSRIRSARHRGAGRPVGAREAGDSGERLGAQHVVVATNTPFNDRVTMHTKQAAYRTYVVGIEVPKDSFPSFLLWDMADPYHYVRRVRGDVCDVLIIGGEDHKTGQADDAGERYLRLERWARERFAGLGETRYRWSGQLMEPVDALGFIGRNPLDDDNVYIVTGDSGDGMTHGTIAGMLIGDLIGERANPWEKLYDPARKTMKAAGTYLGENANFVGHMVRDWVRGGEVHDRADIAPGEGAILREGLSTLAMYRDPAANCTKSRPCARTWDVWCSGMAAKRAGTARAMARDSRSTVRCCMAPRSLSCCTPPDLRLPPDDAREPQPRA